jgi:hypothetical protein
MVTKTQKIVFSMLIMCPSIQGWASTLDQQEACLEAAQAGYSQAVQLASSQYDLTASKCSNLKPVDVLNACAQDAYDTYAKAVATAEAVKKSEIEHCL